VLSRLARVGVRALSLHGRLVVSRLRARSVVGSWSSSEGAGASLGFGPFEVVRMASTARLSGGDGGDSACCFKMITIWQK